ncbi:MAG: GntR family transcriptional regulator [Planctomycetota bacterium]|jgi:DNA-binding LacI/PurR family transcriptional regulator
MKRTNKIKRSKNFLCKEIEEWITSKITSGEYKVGEKLPSENEFTSHFNVCRSTVRRALRDLIDSGIIESRPKVGSFVKRRPPSVLLDSIMVVLPDIKDHFFYALTMELEHALRRAGYLMLLVNSHENGETEVDLLNSFKHIENIKGCIINSCTKELNHLSSQPMPFPVVFLGMKVEKMKADFITLDVYKALSQAVNYLDEAGHRKIGYLRNFTRLKKDSCYDGLRRVLKERNYEIINDWFVSAKDENDYLAGKKAMEKLLKCKQIPTALICNTDGVAAGAVETARENNLRVPEDISIIGWGNNPFYFQQPINLSTIDLTINLLVWETVNLLSQRINKIDVPFPKEVFFPGELIIRDTTAPPLSR